MNIFDFLFPDFLCLVCKCEINVSKKPLVCDSCAEKFPRIEKGCAKCGRPVGRYAMVCDTCKDNNSKRNFDKARAAFIYDEPVAELIMRLKYNDDGHVAKAFAPWLAEAYTSEDIAVDVIVPVPLESRRQKTRGYNQAELIARELAKIINVPVECNVLTRIKRTEPQKNMSVTERRANLKNAFAVTDKKRIKGKRILIVDDVFTSGSTVDECARMLKKYKAEYIDVLTIAITNQKSK